MPGHIEVQSRDEGTRHSYHGLGRCASPLVCPFCSAVIQAHRAAEVMRAGQYMLAHGFQVAMVTLTASHSRTTSLVDFVARFQAAQRDMRMHRQFKNWQKHRRTIYNFGGRNNGRQPGHWWAQIRLALSHAHTFLFRKAQGFLRGGKQKSLQKYFKKCGSRLEGMGLEGSLERAARVDLPRANEKLDAARAQESSESVNNLCAYISKAFGWKWRAAATRKVGSKGGALASGNCKLLHSQIGLTFATVCGVHASDQGRELAALVARTQTVLRHRGRVGQRNTGARRGRGGNDLDF